MTLDKDCPFCDPPADRLFYESELVFGLWDMFPVADGHALIVPKRHFPDWFQATREEQLAIIDGLEAARKVILERHAPAAFNVGINVGPAAGQTIPHLHVHLIPRNPGDVGDPTGGVRNVIPGKGNYLAGPLALLAGAPHESALVKGEDDPLLPHLLAHLAGAATADVAVAFVLPSGVKQIYEHLRDFIGRGGGLRLLTGDYLDVTEPLVLRQLLDFANLSNGRVDLKVLRSGAQGLHAKTYIFRDARGNGLAYVGSSNLTETALGRGLEWNVRVFASDDNGSFAAVCRGFEELYAHPQAEPLTEAWIDEYERRRSSSEMPRIARIRETPAPPPMPHQVQAEALDALRKTRLEGNKAGLVVLATGLGKTWLSAFDVRRGDFKRVLFVAHREEILAQAMGTFRRIMPSAHLGLYTGTERDPDAAVLFASVQTLSLQRHLGRFAPERFDYIIIDEFHHAMATTYRRLIAHFQPAFLLGLTATPERTDGGDLLGLCGENLVFRCDLADGIRRGLLCPFQYFGVPDDTQYENIPWRSNHFAPEELTSALATQVRAQNALDQFRKRGGRRALGFCCSMRHADFMAQYFTAAGLRAVAVHSGPSSAPRAASLEALERGELEIVFAVDMFNEGVDLPNVDTILMLRPTESRILWLQQFGRGLRQLPGKVLRVVDYIGNHRAFLVKPQALFGLGAGDWEIERLLQQMQAGTTELPPACSVTYELEVIEILRGLLRRTTGAEAVAAYYSDYKQSHGARPLAAAIHHEGYNPRVLRRRYGSWFHFVKSQGDLAGPEELALEHAEAFLTSLETTPMTKSFKMVVLLAMIREDCFPGVISLSDLVRAVKRLVGGSAALQRDFGDALESDSALEGLLVKNPIAAWTDGRGTGGRSYFAFDDRRLSTRLISVPDGIREALCELSAEIADWRLSEYLLRGAGDAEAMPIRVGHANGRPILFPLDRQRYPEMPRGWTPVTADGEDWELNFVKVAVNVAHRAGHTGNELADLLRKWFGPDAGSPGTSRYVLLSSSGNTYLLNPL